MPDSPLREFVRRSQRALWVRGSIASVLLGLTLAALLWLAARLLDALGIRGGADVLAVVSLAALVAGVARAALARPSEREAARTVDAALQLRDQVATALEAPSAAEGVPALQVRNAERAIAGVSARKALGGPVSPRRIALAGLAVVLAIGALLLPDLSAVTSRWRTAPVEAGAELATTAPENDVIADIAELKQRLDDGAIDRAEAARQLAAAQDRLNSRIEESKRSQQNLQQLADSVKNLAAAQSLLESLNRGDFDGASQALNDLARNADQLSEQARRDLARALEQAARNTTGNPELAEAERRAAQALQRGDYREIERSLRNLADQVARTGSQVQNQEGLGRAQDRLDDARRQLGQEGEGQQGPQGQQQGQGQGQQAQPGAGQPGGQDDGGGPQPGPGGRSNGIPQFGPGTPGGPGDPGRGQGSEDTPDGSPAATGRPGRTEEIESGDTGGDLRKSEGKGETKGAQLGGARPSTSPGAAQASPDAPVDTAPDTTRVSPDRRSTIRNYFSGGR